MLRNHHAFVLYGELATGIARALTLVEREWGMTARGNPDVRIARVGIFGVGESRALKEWQAARAFGHNGRKAFIGAFSSMTVEAQNALLKVLEEPTEGMAIFLIAPALGALLPTVRSRLVVLSPEIRETIGKGGEQADAPAAAFLAASPVARTAFVRHIVEEKDRAASLALVGALEKKIREALPPPATLDPMAWAPLAALARARRCLFGRSPSYKAVFDFLTATLPKSGVSGDGASFDAVRRREEV